MQTIALGRNDGTRADVLDPGQQRVGVVGFVADDGSRSQIAQQRQGLRHVVDLPSGQGHIPHARSGQSTCESCWSIHRWSDRPPAGRLVLGPSGMLVGAHDGRVKTNLPQVRLL